LAGQNPRRGESAGEDFSPQYKFDVNNDWVLSALDVLIIVNALNVEGEDLVKLVKAEGRVTENIPADGVTPVTRPIVTTVNPGETVLLNAYVEDIRTNDGIADPTSDEFGIFAAYFSVAWNPKAFQVPEGFGDHPLVVPNWPISFLNPEHRQVYSEPGLPNKTTFEYNFNQGLAAQIDRAAGYISEAGSFAFPYHLGRQMPQVPEDQRDVFLNLHVFDVPFTAQSLYAENDQYLVEAGSSVQFSVNDLLGNDGLIVGNYQFTLGGVDGVGREVLTFGDNGTATGQTGQGSVVPEANILFVNPTVNVPLAGRQLTFVGNTQPTKGELILAPMARLNYTPFASVAGPATDTFSLCGFGQPGRYENGHRDHYRPAARDLTSWGRAGNRGSYHDRRQNTSGSARQADMGNRPPVSLPGSLVGRRVPGAEQQPSDRVLQRRPRGLADAHRTTPADRPVLVSNPFRLHRAKSTWNGADRPAPSTVVGRQVP
jgi:hypothetical protein